MHSRTYFDMGSVSSFRWDEVPLASETVEPWSPGFVIDVWVWESTSIQTSSSTPDGPK